MNFESLQRKVRQAEVALEAKERQAAADWRQVKSTWLAVWTPGRIVIAGLVVGLRRSASSNRGKSVAKGNTLLQMLTAVGRHVRRHQRASRRAARPKTPRSPPNNVRASAAGGRMSFVLRTPTNGEQRADARRARVRPTRRSCSRCWPSPTRCGRRRTCCCRCCWRCSSRWSAIRSSACCASCGSRASSARCWCSGSASFGACSLAQQLVTPAGEWIREVPREMRSLAPKLR